MQTPSAAGLGRWLVAIILAAFLSDAFVLSQARADEDKPQAADLTTRPRVPGKFRVELRERRETEPGSAKFPEVSRHAEWEVSETAIIICDMWDDHYCKLSAQRVDEMAPIMNRVISAARSHGALIIHAPSSTLDHYADTPYRRRMQLAPAAEPPVPIAGWCYVDPDVEPEMPVDATKSPCDDPVVGKAVRVYNRQHAAIKIIGFDGVSDKGQEIYNRFRQEGIRNVVLMGVHTNMCVLGRSFGIRQMVRLGFNVALTRDLTDAMYDPREYPYVSHTRGTELVIEHVEKYWCPSIQGRDLMQVVAGSADPDPKTLKRRRAAVTKSGL